MRVLCVPVRRQRKIHAFIQSLWLDCSSCAVDRALIQTLPLGMGAVTVVLPECRDHGTDQACSVSTHLVGTFAMVAVMSHIGRVCVPRVWPCRMSDSWLPHGPEAGGKGGPGSEGAAVRAQAPWQGLSRVAGPAAGAGSGLCSRFSCPAVQGPGLSLEVP